MQSNTAVAENFANFSVKKKDVSSAQTSAWEIVAVLWYSYLFDAACTRKCLPGLAAYRTLTTEGIISTYYVCRANIQPSR